MLIGSILSALLTFLSLELAAIGYLVRQVPDSDFPRSVQWTAVFYGMAVILLLADIIFLVNEARGVITVVERGLIQLSAGSALLSIFCYGASLYTLDNQ